jgi:hypothetical protein
MMFLIIMLTSTGDSVGEYLVQNIAVNYSRPIQFIHEISSPDAYYQEHAPQGSLTISRIIGTKPITSILGSAAQGIWVASSEGAHIATISPVGDAVGPTYKMYGCIVTNYNININANNPGIPETVTITFGALGVA